MALAFCFVPLFVILHSKIHWFEICTFPHMHVQLHYHTDKCQILRMLALLWLHCFCNIWSVKWVFFYSYRYQVKLLYKVENNISYICTYNHGGGAFATKILRKIAQGLQALSPHDIDLGQICLPPTANLVDVNLLRRLKSIELFSLCIAIQSS